VSKEKGGILKVFSVRGSFLEVTGGKAQRRENEGIVGALSSLIHWKKRGLGG